MCISLILATAQPLKSIAYENNKPFVDSIQFEVSDGTLTDQLFTDQQGMLWLSTHAGYLYRYNGSIGSTAIRTDIYGRGKMDDWGRIWLKQFIDESNYAGFLDTNTGKYNPVRFLDSVGKTIESQKILSLIYTKQDIWILAKSGDLMHATITDNVGSTLSFTQKLHFQLHSTALFGRSLSFTPLALNVDTFNNVWISVGDQLIRYHPKDGTTVDFSHLLTPGQRIDYGIDIANTLNHKTWIDMIGINSLFQIDQVDRVTKINMPYRMQDSLADPSRNRIWMASTNGLYYINGEETKLHNYKPEPWQDAGLPSPTIRRLHLDKYNNFWLTSNKGVHVIRSIHDHVQRITPTTSRKNGVFDAGLQVILSLTRENSTILWWINRRQELVRYDTVSAQEQVIPIFNTKLPSDEARSVAYSEPFVLITTHSGNILRFNTKTKRFLDPIKVPFGNISNVNNFLNHIPNEDDQLWLSGFYTAIDPETHVALPHQEKYNYWDNRDQKLVTFTCDTSKNNPLTNYGNADKLSGIFQYYDTQWLTLNSASANVIIQLSLKDHSCQNVDLPFKPDRVYNVTQNDPDSLWLVQGNFLRKMRLSDRAILYDQPLPLTTIDNAQSDQNGHIFIYGEGTLWQFDIANQSWYPLFASEVSFDYNSGFNPFFDAENHKFYFLSHQGILVIDTENKIDLGKPKVEFTAFETGGVKTALYRIKPTAEVKYGEIIQIGFIALPLHPSKLVSYRYRLAEDRPWLYTRNSTLLFSQLPAGTTSLELQAAFNLLDYGKSETLNIIVLPPWWLSKLAYAIYAALIAAFVYGLILWQRNKARLQQAKLTENIFENTSEGICLLSSDYTILNINQAMEAMMGWRFGGNLRQELEKINPINNDISILTLLKAQKRLEHFEQEVKIIDTQGLEQIAKIRVVTTGVESGKKQHILVLENITERKEHEQHLYYLSRHDHLTGLANRLAIKEYLETLIANRSGSTFFSIILFDIDDFKKINESIGHAMGDQILHEVAAKLMLWLKLTNQKEGFLGRLGSDEFLAILPISKNDKNYLNNRLQILLTLFNKLSDDIHLNCSIGVTLFPDNSSVPETLLQQADMAMVLAKQRGKAQIAYYSNQLDTQLKQQLELERALLHNLGHFGLVVYYQPKLVVSTNQIYGVEALSRWQFSEGNLAPPGVFLPLIRPGAMEKNFALAVARQSCKDLLAFQAIQPNFTLSINFSPRLLAENLFTDAFLSIISELNVNPRSIIAEVLEDAGIGDTVVFNNLQRLRTVGIAISIDDFGTGYSSLSHLNRLAADEIKSDRSFMNGIPGDTNAELMFETIIAFGSKFNMSVVCEGVETKEQLDFIRQCGCTHYQGFYFSPPIHVHKIVELLSHSDNTTLESQESSLRN